ncbi:MAG: amino acid adenylation domain-containing protein [Myxococcaceae bacterium]|nr:amino acid adenylation domain-containing protein [Myxococcaceae bacterium]
MSKPTPSIEELSPERRRALLVEMLQQRAGKPREAPVSFSQQRLWFLDQMEPGSAFYNVPTTLRLPGLLDLDALVRSLRELVRRHEALRTTFATVDGTPVQRIVRSLPLEVPVEDLRRHPAREQELQRLAQEEAQRPFDLGNGPLLRARVIRLADTDHVLLLTLHHIVCDGWSMGVLQRELAALYGAFSSGRPSPLKDLPIQYADFARWQHQTLRGEALEKLVSYWREQLAGAPTLLELPTDRPRPPVQVFRGATLSFFLPLAVTQSLKSLAQREGATLFMVLLTAFDVWLYRYTGQRDLLVGTPIANRTRAELEELVGFFVNTLVLRSRISESMSFRALLRQVREVTLGAYAHQDLPFEKLVEELQPERSLSHNPFFQVMFVLQNLTREPEAVASAEAGSAPQAGTGTAKFDITLSLLETPQGLTGSLEYNTDLFDAPTLQRMAGHLQVLLGGIAANPDQLLERLPLLTHGERRHLLVELNATRSTWPPEGLLHRLFEAQVERTPDAIAVIAEGRQLTYRELDALANRVSHHLRSLGVGPDVRVGVCMERSIELVAGLLGILKAGGAYVPLDPSYPRDRLAFMLTDSQASVLVTQARLRDQLPASTARVVLLDSGSEALLGPVEHAPSVEVSPEGLAYVIYTSGSTGRPKGVMIPHVGIVNHVRWMLEQWPMTASDVVLQKTPISFDASVWEFFVPLTAGARLVMARPDDHRASAMLAKAIEQHGVTILQVVPSMLGLLLEEPGLERCTWLRLLFSGGEALPRALQERCHHRLKVELVNLYGPTEASIDATSWVCRADGASRNIPIGRPVSNTRLYVLDEHLEPVPAGVTGQLYIAGAGLARGYLGRPELTAERFLPDPFSDSPGERMYQTGDLVRYLPDGSVDFLGRADHQVKVRGFRIELGEIEAVLRRHPMVRECVAVVREDTPGDQRLVAYVVATGSGPSAHELRAFAAQFLPAFMAPSAFVALPAVPLLPNGKVDRRALPAPETERASDKENYVAPRNPTEEAVARIWAEVLRVERVGAHDDFFELGGHSLTATQVVSRLRTALRVEVPLRNMFEKPTVASLAEFIQEARIEKAPPLAPSREEALGRSDLPLSFAQQRLWFLDQLEPGSSFYNVPTAMSLQLEVKPAVLEQVLNEIVRRHEALRTSFTSVGGEPAQVIAPSLQVELPVVDLRSLPKAAQLEETERRLLELARRPFTLSRGPLLSALLLQRDTQDWTLCIVLHHIITDGWSLLVLQRELTVLYEAFLHGRPSPLPRLPLQYADFALWQRTHLQGERLQQLLDYWRHQLDGAPPLLELATDRPRPFVQVFRGATQPFVVPATLLKSARALAQQHGTTLFMLLLAVFDTLLYRHSGQEDLVVGTPIANRTRVELEGLIGFFVNTLALRTRLSRGMRFVELLQQVRQVTLGAYAHQDLPFEKLVEELRPERNLGHNPIFQVMLVLQNAPGQEQAGGPAVQEALADAASKPRPRLGLGTSKFDLTFSFTETEEGLLGLIEYNTDLFDASRIAWMGEHFRLLLEAATARPEERLDTLPLLTEAERRQVLSEWNQTRADYPVTACLHHPVEAQVKRTPEAVAVQFAGQSLSYRELNRRANALARRLRGLGVGPDTCVGVCLERSLELAVGLLGILKAGGAYVPLDPDYPAERLAFMLSAAQVRWTLALPHLAERLPLRQAHCEWLDPREVSAMPTDDTDFSSGAGPDNLAYVIFTSGSTGRPKGVAMSHRPLVNLVTWQQERSSPGPSRTLQFASPSFDVSAQEMFSTWCSGGTLVLLPEDARKDALQLSRHIEASGVERLFLPFVMLQQFAREAEEGTRLGKLRRVLTAGEQLHVTPEVVRLFDALGGAPLHNQYGPTETHVVTEAILAGPPGHWPALPPIGRPISNVELYVLDEALQPVPIGVPGELYCGGDALARGYIHAPALTAERFIPHPFSRTPGARLYRTGDRVRYRVDGSLEFLGRVDQQVKIRGFRVEPEEVAAVLREHPSVREAVLLAREEPGGERRLVAYFLGSPDAPPSPAELRAFLMQKLPGHLQPGAFVSLERWPLTPSGKLDRRALPAPDRESSGTSSTFEAPRTPLEEQLAGIWSLLLPVKRIGIRDSFFDLGGHSLMATRVLSQVRDALQVELPLRRFFEHPTIADQAVLILEAWLTREDGPGATAVLEEVASLPEEQVRALLAEPGSSP